MFLPIPKTYYFSVLAQKRTIKGAVILKKKPIIASDINI